MSDIWLSGEGRARLRRALGGSPILASSFEDAVHERVADDAGRDRLEALFPKKAFHDFLAAWPRKSTDYFAVISRALVEKASRASDLSARIRMCRVLARRDFRKTLDRYVLRTRDLEGLAAYVGGLLDLAAAGASRAPTYLALASTGLLAALDRLYPRDSPVLEYLRDWAKRAVALGSSAEEASAFLELLLSDELAGLAALAEESPQALGLVVGPFLEAWLRADEAGRASVTKRLRLVGRAASRLRIPGIPAKEARLGFAAAVAPLAAGLERRSEADFSRFVEAYGFDRLPEGPLLWSRLVEKPELYVPELGFLSSKAFLDFLTRLRLDSGSAAALLVVELVLASVEPERIRLADPALLALLPSLLLRTEALYRDRAFLRARAELFAKVAARTSSQRLRGVFLEAYAEEIALVARRRCALEEGRLVLPPRKGAFRSLVEAELDDPVFRSGRGAEAERRVEGLLARALEDLWKPVAERLGPERAAGRAALRSLCRLFDLEDRALSELEAVADVDLDPYLAPILELEDSMHGLDFVAAREAAWERLARDYRHRLEFGQAYPYIAEMTIPIAGSIACLPDFRGNWAWTDGVSIYLPRYLAWFPDDPELLPENRNLTIYVGLALHEAAHIVGGTFAVDWRPFVLGLEKPLLFHAIFNALEDFRVERLIRAVAPHPQAEEILETVNRCLYRETGDNPVFTFLITAFGKAAGYWDELALAFPKLAEDYAAFLASDYPAGDAPSLAELGEGLRASLEEMDECDPTAAFRLARELYDCMCLWPAPEPPADLRGLAREGRGYGGTSGSVLGAMNDSGLYAPEGASRSVGTLEELQALAEEFSRDPEACLRSLGVKTPERALALRSARLEARARSAARGASGSSCSAALTAAPGGTGTGDYGAAIPLAGPSSAVSPTRESERRGEEEDLSALAEEVLIACGRYAYEARGRVERAEYGREEGEAAKRQGRYRGRGSLSGERSTSPRRKGAGKRAKRGGRGGASVVLSGRRTGSDRLLSVCRVTRVREVSRPFLEANRRYDGLSRRIGTMLAAIVEEASRSDPELSAVEGDVDDEKLIEILADPRRSEGRFLEFPDDWRRSLSVIIGLDASGSTAAMVRPLRPGAPTVIDVEKHFALIFSRALRPLGGDVSVLAFNSEKGTNIYRFEPVEALTSLRPDAANRDGDFVRFCTAELARSASELRYLFLISDGMPSAIGYEGAAALDDTILSLQEARKAGVRVIYLNIDSEELDYFGRFADETVFAERFRRPEELIAAAPALVKSLADEVL